MLKITPSFAKACTSQDLHCLLHRLFNHLAERDLDHIDRQCCLVSIDTVRSELAHPSR